MFSLGDAGDNGSSHSSARSSPGRFDGENPFIENHFVHGSVVFRC